MQKNLEQKVRTYCERHQMLQQNDAVVVGVSGGADSVCLLFVLLSLREHYHLNLHVVHINHGIRPDAAEDAAYVKELCDKYELPFYLAERNIPAEAEKNHCSEEEAGRLARYEVFEKIRKEKGCEKIAVAHHKNDLAETMLFHLFRGTGLAGLAGIRPVRGEIIRPLLCLERSEIEAYLADKQIPYRHDSTNDSDEYTRNKIRHHILNYAQEKIANAAVSNMARTADILAETENYIEEQVQAARAACVREGTCPKEGYQIDKEKYLQLHSAICKRLLLSLLKELAPGHRDITAGHVEDIHSLFTEDGNRCIHLPYGIRGQRVYGEIRLERVSVKDTEKPKRQPVFIAKEEITTEGVTFCLQNGDEITLKRCSGQFPAIKTQDIPQNKYTKWLDYDKIIECLVIRTRKEGDFLCVKTQETMHHKKVKDYMVTEKIPRQERDQIPVLAEGDHVLWLIGYRISEYYKISENTKHILQITYRSKDAE